MNVKKNNIKYIVIVAFVIVIMSVIILIVLGDAKDDTPSVGTESEIIESEMRESEVIESEVLLTEDKETEFEETESQMTSEMETQQDASPGDNAATTKPGNTQNNSGSTNNGGNTGSTNNGGNTGNNGTNNGGSSGGNTSNGGGNVSDVAPNVPQYDPADTNKDGWVDAGEEMAYITPQKQKCIDAGYGVVVEQDGGEWYAVLMKDSDHKIDGKEGWEILDKYLKDRNLCADQITGCWINSDNEWYWYIAKDIEEIPESTDGTGSIDWDDLEWEFND